MKLKSLWSVRTHALFGFFNSIGRGLNPRIVLPLKGRCHAPHTTPQDTIEERPSSDNPEMESMSVTPGMECAERRTKRRKSGFVARIEVRLRESLATLGYRTSVRLLRGVLRCRETQGVQASPTSDRMSDEAATVASTLSSERFLIHLPEERLAHAIYNRLAYVRGLNRVNFLPNVKCGGTAAQDSQSEANERRYPPLPPTTCSAS